jgi:hypothetical protein
MKQRIPEIENSRAHIAICPIPEGSITKSSASCRKTSGKAGNSKLKEKSSLLIESRCGATMSILPSLKKFATCKATNCICKDASSIFQAFSISNASLDEIVFTGQVSNLGLHIATAIASAMDLNYGRPLAALVINRVQTRHTLFSSTNSGMVVTNPASVKFGCSVRPR